MANYPSHLDVAAKLLRIHSIRGTTAAGSGHPTSCLSAADIVAALFFQVMRFDPKNAKHPNNDRFILSKGHAAPLLYAAWAEAGIIAKDKIPTLRLIDSDLEGHPTFRLPWAEVGTGSLGQGLSIGVGMALNAKYLDKIDYRTYVLMGDGETAEGGVWEAVALASYYKLDNLVAIVDVNGLGQSQATMFHFNTDSYAARFKANGWHAIVVDGNSFASLLPAFDEAAKTFDKPTAIIAKTQKGAGVSFLAGKEGWHGKALKKEEEEKAVAEIGMPVKPLDWKPTLPKPATLAQPPKSFIFPTPAYKKGDKVATRTAYGAALHKLGAAHPLVVGLDGDTKNSTYADKFMKAHPNRFFECFIAEQNMVGAAVGLAVRGKIPFASTFGAFLTRAYDHIRMGVLSNANIKLVGSHCGVSIGEDGPSQMALEDIAMMRAIPGATILYPSDPVAGEKLVAEAAKIQGIVYIRTSRPATPVIYDNLEEFPIGGSKVVRSSPGDAVTVVAAGVALHEAIAAADELKKENIFVRIVDAYSVKPVDKAGILAAAQATKNRVITVEDHYPEGGLGDAVLSAVATDNVRVWKLAINGVPHSGKAEELLHKYGIDRACIAAKVREVIQR